MERCREAFIREGASRVAISKGDECSSGYVEYEGEVFAIGIYEYRDIGVIAGKVSPEALDTCVDLLYTPHGYIAYGRSYEELCRNLASKMKRLAKKR